MEYYMEDLVQKLRKRNVEQKGSFKAWNDVEVDYYVVESDEVTLRFWNSANTSEPRNISEILDDIRSDIMDGESSGSTYDGWNEIQWEVI